VGTFSEAASHGDVLVLCCFGEAVEEVIRLSGMNNFDGKLLIDATTQCRKATGRRIPEDIWLGRTYGHWRHGWYLMARSLRTTLGASSSETWKLECRSKNPQITVPTSPASAVI